MSAIEVCPIVRGAKALAVKQGLDAAKVECPLVCDRREPCVTSPVEVFDAKLDKTKRALELADIARNAKFFSNGDRI